MIHTQTEPEKPFIRRGRTENRPGCLVPAALPSPLLAQIQVLIAWAWAYDEVGMAEFTHSQPRGDGIRGLLQQPQAGRQGSEGSQGKRFPGLECLVLFRAIGIFRILPYAGQCSSLTKGMVTFFFLFFCGGAGHGGWFHHVTCKIFPNQGWKHGVVTTGPPGKS